MLHVQKTEMLASAQRTCAALRLKSGDSALLCLPIKYISGKMMVVRALVAKLRLIDVPVTGHPLAGVPADIDIDFAAMTPLQVFNSLGVPEEKASLCRIKKLIIGGAAIDPELEKSLRDLPNEIYSTYGMTETLSHIALRRLNGPAAQKHYHPLPGIEISADEDGCLIIAGTLKSNDIVKIFPDKSFVVLGRKDNVVNSGGVKVQIEVAEAKLQAANPQNKIVLTAVPDKKFGEMIVALCEGDPESVNCDSLDKYERPKKILKISKIPLTPTHKTDRAGARRLAQAIFGGNAGTAEK